MAANNLIQRKFNFAVDVGRLAQELPFNQINKIYINQILRCSSSVYANYRASQRAKSDADFLNKLKIVEEECDETIGFLQLILTFNPTYQQTIDGLIKEGNEILKITVSSINTVRHRMNKK